LVNEGRNGEKGQVQDEELVKKRMIYVVSLSQARKKLQSPVFPRCTQFDSPIPSSLFLYTVPYNYSVPISAPFTSDIKKPPQSSTTLLRYQVPSLQGAKISPALKFFFFPCRGGEREI
jgi:hypothetical protein